MITYIPRSMHYNEIKSVHWAGRGGSRLYSQHFGGAEAGGSLGEEIETILVNMVKPCLY